MRAYLDLLRDVLEHGVSKGDRTGTGTLSVFGRQMRFDLTRGFPLVTTKKLHLKSIVHELLWFLQGDTNIAYLKAHGVSIWDDWADEEGDLGPVYGRQWRSWPAPEGGSIDQIAWLLTRSARTRIRAVSWSAPGTRPISPRWRWRPATACSSSMWRPGADGVARLSCQLYQRSGDIFLGVPFNIASYALLTHMVAHVTGLGVGDFVHTLGDAHLYVNHLEQARLQLQREPRPLPRLKLDPAARSLFDIALRGHRGRGLRPLAGDPGAGRGVIRGRFTNFQPLPK